jgi:hypothetical protein
MAGLTFKINGLDLTKLKEYAAEVQSLVQDEMDVTAYDIQAEQKSLAPVDLGALRAGIATVHNGNKIESVSSAEYSGFVNFGTGTFVDVEPPINTGSLENFYIQREELAAYALQFKGKGIRQVNLPPREFFFSPIYRNFGLMLERIKKIMQEADK